MKRWWRWLRRNAWALSIVGLTGVMFAPESYKLAGALVLGIGIWIDSRRNLTEGAGK